MNFETKSFHGYLLFSLLQDSPMENVILADISRTFTAHDKFKTESEGGQDAMYKISKVRFGGNRGGMGWGKFEHSPHLINSRQESEGGQDTMYNISKVRY